MSLPLNLGKAVWLAAEAHRGQVDKAGQAYILHPIRVMLRMEDDEDKIVAVLHDVVEDCEGWTVARVAEMFDPDIAEAVDALSRRKEQGETYWQYIERLKVNPIARRVKLADIADNLDPKRDYPGRNEKLLERYRKAALIVAAQED